MTDDITGMTDEVQIVAGRDVHLDGVVVALLVEDDLDVVELVEVAGQLLDLLAGVVTGLLAGIATELDLLPNGVVGCAQAVLVLPVAPGR